MRRGQFVLALALAAVLAGPLAAQTARPSGALAEGIDHFQAGRYDLALAGYILLVDFESPARLRLDLAFLPDAGLLYLALLILTLGWGSLRTILAIGNLFVNSKVTASNQGTVQKERRSML